MKPPIKLALLWLFVSPAIFAPVLAVSTHPDIRSMVFQGVLAIAALIAFAPWVTTRVRAFATLRAKLWPFDLVDQKHFKAAITIKQCGRVLDDAGFGSSRLMLSYVLKLGLVGTVLVTMAELFPDPFLGVRFDAVFMFWGLAVNVALAITVLAILMARASHQT